MATPYRAHWGRLIGASLAVLAAAHLAPRVLTPPDLDENRALAAFPAAPKSFAELETFRTGVDAWVADRFPARPYLIGGLNALKLRFGVSGSSRVIVGRDGWLFYDDTTHLGAARGAPALTTADARAWLRTLAGRTEALAARGVPYIVLSPPEKEVVYARFAPAWFDGPDPNRWATRLTDLARASGAGRVLYVGDDLVRPTTWGLKTYSRHDTHWTGLGAWYGYAALMRELQARGVGTGPRPLDAFADVSGPRAQPRNLALMLGVSSFVDVDYPELEDPDASGAITVTYLTERRDWTAPHVIDTGQAGKPVLLMTMDSFSNALVPFLYGDFSRIILAHNQDGVWREDLMARFQPHVVVMEVLESGLDTAMAGGPPPSADAVARIEATLGAPPPLRRRPEDEAMGDPIDGSVRADNLQGTAAGEVIQGLPGDDTLAGLGGPDLLRGGRGADSLDGGDGPDWLGGGREDDVLRGGRGPDIFNSFPDAGVDRVLDFDAAAGDRVRLDAGTAYTVGQEGGDTVIEMAGARLILQGVKAADLPPGTIGRR